MKPSERLKPLHAAVNDIHTKNWGYNTEHRNAVQKRVDAECSILDDHAERLRKDQALLTALAQLHSRTCSRDVKGSLEEIAGTASFAYLATLSEPSETWPSDVVAVWENNTGSQWQVCDSGIASNRSSKDDEWVGHVTGTVEDWIASYDACKSIHRIYTRPSAPSIAEQAKVIYSRDELRVGMLVDREVTDRLNKSILGDGVSFEWADAHGRIVRITGIDQAEPANGGEEAREWAERYINIDTVPETRFILIGSGPGNRQAFEVSKTASIEAVRTVAVETLERYLTAYAANATAKLRAERDKWMQESHDLTWNLAGCQTIADGGPTEYSKELARPALDAVLKLRSERDSLRAKCEAQARVIEAQGKKLAYLSACWKGICPWPIDRDLNESNAKLSTLHAANAKLGEVGG